MSAPSAFCLDCRALLDEGQRCPCGEKARTVPLVDGADDAIEKALLVIPHLDGEDLTSRIVVGSVTALGPVGLVFFLGYVMIFAVAPPLAEAWPWFLGIPYAVIAAGWIAFMTWSTLEERKPYYRAVRRARPRPERVEEARVDTGRLIATELHQRRDAELVVVRDARVEEPLVLRRAGQRITVPAGRVDVYFPADRWRSGPAPLVAEWRALPEEILRAGALLGAKLRAGDRVALFDGELEPLGRDETGFREAAEESFRWVPAGGRSRLLVLET